jgi:hypothetical protein
LCARTGPVGRVLRRREGSRSNSVRIAHAHVRHSRSPQSKRPTRCPQPSPGMATRSQEPAQMPHKSASLQMQIILQWHADDFRDYVHDLRIAAQLPETGERLFLIVRPSVNLQIGSVSKRATLFVSGMQSGPCVLLRLRPESPCHYPVS